MTETNWGALFAVAQKVADDIRTNRPPPAPDGSSPSFIEELPTLIPQWRAAWATHYGVESAVADVLAAMVSDRVPYAATIRNAFLSTPGALAAIEDFLPAIELALTAFSGATENIGAGRRIGRG